MLCALAAIGDTAAQLGPHARACLQVGNSKAEVVAALVHCFPYIGFPRTVAAVRAVLSFPAGQELSWVSTPAKWSTRSDPHPGN